MNEKDLTNRLKVLYDQLKFFHLFPEDAEKRYGGEKGVLEQLDVILDAINDIQKQLQYPNNDKKV